ncbi:hypothetical protein J5N97_028258 [Dioscorea zingiberensis]|uniref:Spt5 KOWx domain-containing protein n=1 Tax=Dioscorea zingiberensis TaxID=325984 RepID=A0A9D5H4P3_9LILI|nr:hypothetical protein J5N97_028258 [Dioscorea zingiberensis]
MSFDGLMLKDGFVYKKVSIGSLVCWGVQPSKAELLNFSESNKDEAEDLDWISSVYSGRRKIKVVEASHQTSNDKQGNGYDLYDLVLFGRKDFGVIIALEKDSYRILKGGMGSPEVVTVKQQEIKNSCVDKMFTALDRGKKTVYINDVVKVLRGLLEGEKSCSSFYPLPPTTLDGEEDNGDTFDENMLAVPNLRRDEPAATSLGSLGAQDRKVTDQEPGAGLWDSKIIFGSVGGACDSSRDNDCWDKSIGPKCDSSNGWEKDKLSTGDAGGSWGTESFAKTKELVLSDNQTGNWDTIRTTAGSVDGWGGISEKGKGISLEQGSCWTSTAAEVCNDKYDAWDAKGTSMGKNEDAWTKVGPHGKDVDDGKGWGKSLDNPSQRSRWNNEDNKESGRNNQNTWEKPTFEGGQFGRGRGEGKMLIVGSWDKKMGFNGERGSSWGGRRGGNGEFGGVEDEGSKWNQQKDYDGSKGPSWGRGRGRYGGRGNRDQNDSWNGVGESGGWRSSGGRGRGRNEGNNMDNEDASLAGSRS